MEKDTWLILPVVICLRRCRIAAARVPALGLVAVLDGGGLVPHGIELARMARVRHGEWYWLILPFVICLRRCRIAAARVPALGLVAVLDGGGLVPHGIELARMARVRHGEWYWLILPFVICLWRCRIAAARLPALGLVAVLIGLFLREKEMPLAGATGIGVRFPQAVRHAHMFSK